MIEMAMRRSASLTAATASATLASFPMALSRTAHCSMAEVAPDGEDGSWQFKLLLLTVAIGYGTNFPVGRLMNEALPAAASTSGRFVLAALALSPFIPRLDRRLIWPAVVTGLCDGVGYSAQSLALCDTPAAKVSLLGLTLILTLTPTLTLTLSNPIPIPNLNQVHTLRRAA